ncbi:MAG: endonuclease III [Thermodesulfobacteriota bacterium]|nr:MAG: endonuclease III [Thermodesulfobacteriota bacterium]
MKSTDIPEVMRILRSECAKLKTPYVTVVSEGEDKDPFRVLVSCILSLRTKDSTTRASSERLFNIAPTAEKLAALKVSRIEKAIYPAGFYRTKAVQLKDIAGVLVRTYSSKVPDTIDELLKLKGVGRKTANLVVTMGYGKPGICVDTHVHRITNRWGLVRTKNPLQTEYALRETLDKRYWIPFNDLLVTYGQNICRPVSPLCSRCPIYRYCERRGVEKRR